MVMPPWCGVECRMDGRIGLADHANRGWPAELVDEEAVAPRGRRDAGGVGAEDVVPASNAVGSRICSTPGWARKFFDVG